MKAIDEGEIRVLCGEERVKILQGGREKIGVCGGRVGTMKSTLMKGRMVRRERQGVSSHIT